ncbi:protein-L-isoaspartate(D-aspartate) O-methyltransferase [Candidatus Poribacteria bacterium]|nr:protein-L-isoaspartate(D-aspartate) O-methyltransferase [Candidatus Poribacteria bacterium]
MVEKQLIGRDITDPRVLEAMGKIPRHWFVGDSYQNMAYTDQPLPIGQGQTISQPYMVALMTELLALEGTEKVLEIGTGSGYQTAVLAELAEEVYTVEIVEPLAKKAREILEKIGYDNIKFKIGNGYYGWKEYAPYDLIIVTCGPEEVPDPLLEQMAEDGKLVIPVGSVYQTLTIYEKKNDRLKKKHSIACRFVPMTGI